MSVSTPDASAPADAATPAGSVGRNSFHLMLGAAAMICVAAVLTAVVRGVRRR